MAEVIPPPYFITPTDRRGLVVVMTALVLAFVWTSLVIRLYLRVKLKEWKIDDSFLVAATIFDTIQSGVVINQAQNGFGNSLEFLSASHLTHIGKADFASQILYVWTLLLSKGAILFLYLRVSPGRSHAWASWGLLVFSVVWFLLSVILISVHCNPLEFWTNGAAQCGNLFVRWQVIGALDIITEILIFSVSVYLVAGLNMRIMSKLTVIGAFSARLPVIVAAAVRLHYLKVSLASSNPSFTAAYMSAATQWQLGYAIMASTISGLGPFLRPFAKTFSTRYRMDPSDAGHSANSQSQSQSQSQSHAHSQSHSHAPSFQLASLSPKTHIGSRNESRTPTPPIASGTELGMNDVPLRLRPERVTREVECRHDAESGADEERASLQSNDSRRMIITKKMQWSVDHDQASVRDQGTK